MSASSLIASALQHVEEFAHVAGPAVSFEDPKEVLGEAFEGGSAPLAQHSHVADAQGPQVVEALPQGGMAISTVLSRCPKGVPSTRLSVRAAQSTTTKFSIALSPLE